MKCTSVSPYSCQMSPTNSYSTLTSNLETTFILTILVVVKTLSFTVLWCVCSLEKHKWRKLHQCCLLRLYICWSWHYRHNPYITKNLVKFVHAIQFNRQLAKHCALIGSYNRKRGPPFSAFIKINVHTSRTSQLLNRIKTKIRSLLHVQLIHISKVKIPNLHWQRPQIYTS